MKKRTLGLSGSLAALALAAAGAAYAAPEASKRGPDADANGVVTRGETQAHAGALFARLDVNKDGQLNPADREARREQRLAERFGQLDTDKNGQISRGEFAARPTRPEAGPEAKPDGHRGWHGGHGGGKHGGGWSGHGRGGMMMGGMMMGGRDMAADADGNGAISQAEFTAAALARFDKTDADKDGKVTKEERRAAREQMRAKWRENRSQAAPAKPAS